MENKHQIYPPRGGKTLAFTLSEVLITLVVIGIIAAITVPIVMAVHKRQETSAKLKKFYSALSQAIKLAQLDNSDFIIDSRGERGYDKFDIWWNKYLSNFPVTKQANTNYVIASPSEGITDKPSFLYVLNDGSIVIFYSSTANMISLLFDINGENGPNYVGRDIFKFRIYEYPGHSEAHWIKVCTSTGSCHRISSSSGINRDSYIKSCKQSPFDSCTGLIQSDGWEIKSDYPHRI